MAYKLLNLLVLLTLSLALRAQPQARFSAEEAQAAYYQMGWDSMDEATTWTYSPSSSGNFTWHLEERTPYGNQQPFSSIDPISKYSLCCRYSNSDYQNEVAASPTIEIRPNSTVEFYACFRSVFLVYAPWHFYMLDIDGDSIAYHLNAFLWSQFNEFTGPAWQKFSIDLTPYAGMKATFAFQFTGPGGEDLAIDGFRVTQNMDTDSSAITINEGDAVHFIDRSTGDITEHHWLFPGGTPAESSEQHPVVVYDQAGSYTATLTVRGPDGESTVTREQYINVVGQTPIAVIGLPEEGYLSPWVARFVPAGLPLHYTDQSTGRPTTWHWTFEGGQPAESDEQHPVVTYPEEGVYGMTLDVANAVGTTQDFMVHALQVGGSQFVWNIGLDEYDLLGEIALGWYGYYGGTNWLGIEKFAERFAAPPQPATIDSVQVFFYNTQTVTPDAEITVELYDVGPDDMPCHVIAKTSCKASELAYDEKEIIATDFVFDHPVTLSTDFFIAVGGFPHNEGDGISMLSVRRDEGRLTTTWHLLEDEDPHTYERLGTYTWYKNCDDAVSLCVTPRLSYPAAEKPSLLAAPTRSSLPSAIYDLHGQRTMLLTKGLNIICHPDGTVSKRLK